MSMVRISQILCPVDFSDTSRRALAYAASIARWYEARLTVVYVFVNRPSADLPAFVLERPERDRLAENLRRFTASVSSEVSLVLRVEEAPTEVDGIIDQATSSQADLLVVGTHGRTGFERLFLGSVAEKVIRKAPCPLLVVPPHAPDATAGEPVQFHRILCAVDFSESSRRALAYAMDLAEEADAALTLLHVVDIPRGAEYEIPLDALDDVRDAAAADARRRLDSLVPDEARTYCTVETVVTDGRTSREILKHAGDRQADLIVAGASGRGAIDRMLFGSTVHAVIRGSACPVLVIPHA